MIQVDISNIWGALSLPDLLAVEKDVSDAHTKAADGTGLPLFPLYASEELRRIQDAADKIRSDSDVCVVVSPGGGSLGARAAMELLQGSHRNLSKTPQIFFTGSNLSSRKWKELTGLLEGKHISVIVTAGPDSTPEPAIALRGLRWMLERKYGTDEASSRVYAITNPQPDWLCQLAREEQWMTFAVPAGAAGQLSVLSAAGLLPMAVAGIDIHALLRGAAGAQEALCLRSFENPVWLYAGVRNALCRQGREMELLECFEPDFRSFGLWWQQLFSQGGKGVFPAAAVLPADLHGLSPLIQAGHGKAFETVLRFAAHDQPVPVCSDWKNLDGLGDLEGKNLEDVAETAFQELVWNHCDRGLPVMTMDCGMLCEETLGELFYFMELACGICDGMMADHLKAEP